MKKLFWPILLIVLLLATAQAAFADHKNGDPCPDCGKPLTVQSGSSNQHLIFCDSCGYGYLYKFGDHTVVCPSCGEECTDHVGQSFILTNCDNCGYFNMTGNSKTIIEDHWGLNELCFCQGCETICHKRVYLATKDPTCTEPGVSKECYYCTRCQRALGPNDEVIPESEWKIPAKGHKWDTAWTVEGNKHYHKCLNDGCTARNDEGEHSGGKATCTQAAICTKCKWSYGAPDTVNGHDLINHDKKDATCTDAGWEAYQTCSRCDYNTYQEIPALKHDLIDHAKKEPTCTDVGWEAYQTCSRCDYNTYKEIPALKHDLIDHAKKEPTCTDVGWEAYKTCSRCDYSTYKEIPANGHKEVTDPRVDPTCTGTGLTEGKHCSVCSEVLTPQAEIEATGHTEVSEKAVAATCTKSGRTEGTYCSVCGEVLSGMKKIPAKGHAFGDWTPAGKGQHANKCTRCSYTLTVDCVMIEIPQDDPDAAPVRFCPVCGQCEGKDDLQPVEGVEVKGTAVKGNLVAFMAETEDAGFLSVAFESKGKPVPQKGDIAISLPEDLTEGIVPVLIGPDGVPANAVTETDENGVTIRLTCTGDDPALLFRLEPKE